MNFKDIIDLAYQGEIDEARKALPNIEGEGADVLRKIAESYIFRLENQNEKALEQAIGAIDSAKKIGIIEYVLMSFSEYLTTLSNLSRIDDIIKFEEELTNYCRDKSQAEIGSAMSHLANINNILGLAYSSSGNKNKALDYYEKAIEYNKLVNNTVDLAAVLGNMGVLYHDEGKLDNALEYYNNALSILGDSDPLYESMLKNNIGNLYNSIGEVDKALDYLLESLEIKENMGNQKGIANTLVNLGEVYFKLGNISTAEEMVQNAHSILLKYGDADEIANTILQLMKLAIHLDNQKDIERYRTEMYELQQSSNLKIVSQKYELALGLIAMSGKRLVNKVVARSHFQNIVDDTMMEFEVYVEALKNLIELYFLEISSVGLDTELLDMVKELLDDLTRIGRKSKSFTIVIESLILKAKYNLLMKNFDQVIDLLDNAELISEEKGLVYQNLVIKDLKEQIISQLDNLKSISANSEMTLQNDIIDNYIESIKRMKKS